MKKILIRLSLLMAAVAFVTLSSCSKTDDENPGGGGNPPSGNFSAKLDGNDFSAVQYNASVDDNHDLVIGGIDNQGGLISIVLANFNGEGSFNFSPNSNEGGAFYTPDTSNVLNSYATVGENGSGNATITAWDGTDSIVTGTFSFVAEHITNGSTVTVTEGVFNNIQVVYNNASGGGGGPGNNSFSVKIDGTLWEETGSNVNGITNAGILVVTAINPTNTSSFIVSMPADITVGNHPLDFINYNIIYTPNNTNPAFVPTSGSIQVTQHDLVNNQIEATFNFEGLSGVNTLSFTDGQFSVNY